VVSFFTRAAHSLACDVRAPPLRRPLDSSRAFTNILPPPVPRSKKAEGQARKLATKEAKTAKEEAAQAALEDAEWEVGGKKANKKQELDAAKKAAKAERKVEADAQVRWPRRNTR